MTLTNDIPAPEANVVASMALADNKAKPGRKNKPAPKNAAATADGLGKTAAGKIRAKTKPPAPTDTKASLVLKKLALPKGVTIDVLIQATGWQAHSVRGFLSAVVRKKLGLNLVGETGKDGVRRYRIGGLGKAK